MSETRGKPTLQRQVVKFLGRTAVHLLTRLEISGWENLPESGAYIMAGNHVGAMEAILMVCFAPRIIEVVGSGDIPLDPKLSPFADLYGFIPINRGEIDQRGLNEALAVLNSGGVLGVFPEGGIWEAALKAPKPGIAWLSMKSAAPVVPIGFVGMRMALTRALKIKFPKIKMVIGKPIHPQAHLDGNLPLKDRLVKFAELIMDEIAQLLPVEDRIDHQADIPPAKQIQLEIKEPGNEINIELVLENGESFSKLIQHPIIMDVFKRNLNLPVEALAVDHQYRDVQSLLIACNALISLLTDKPGFLPYRFGLEEGLRMQASLIELRDSLLNFPMEGSLFRIVEK